MEHETTKNIKHKNDINEDAIIIGNGSSNYDNTPKDGLKKLFLLWYI